MGHVYLWLEREGDALRVAYVGKAGKTMKDRFRQHLSGFSGKSKKQGWLKKCGQSAAGSQQWIYLLCVFEKIGCNGNPWGNHTSPFGRGRSPDQEILTAVEQALA